jgi:hypothetical protein
MHLRVTQDRLVRLELVDKVGTTCTVSIGELVAHGRTTL